MTRQKAVKVVIVEEGDPNNCGFDYKQLAYEMQCRIRAWGRGRYDIKTAGSAEEAIKELGTNRGTVMFMSASYCAAALELARRYSPQIRFVVYSVGLAPIDMPVFAFRGMMNETTCFAFLE